jgi:hypothetical protein
MNPGEIIFERVVRWHLTGSSRGSLLPQHLALISETSHRLLNKQETIIIVASSSGGTRANVLLVHYMRVSELDGGMGAG